MKINFKKNILFTGAGFTANFGGFLASQMWQEIFNHPGIDSLPGIKERMRTNFDFEDFYSELYWSNHPSAHAYQNLIIDTFLRMDERIKRNPQILTAMRQNLGQLFSLFSGSGGEVGAHFTLNQDLFMERHFSHISLGFHGTGVKYKEYSDAVFSHSLDPKKRMPMPDEDFIKEIKSKYLLSIGNACYVKLHGSLGWDTMVFGTNKFQLLSEEPLLKWYLELFEQALSRPDARILIIGYGFRDDHINARLLESAKKHRLKLYIVTPSSPADFRQRNADFWHYVDGFYHPNEVFTEDANIVRTSDLWKTFQ